MTRKAIPPVARPAAPPIQTKTATAATGAVSCPKKRSARNMQFLPVAVES